MKRPIALWFLVFWLVFLALGGVYGGVTMLLDPSGKLLAADELLPLLPVPDFILPGLFLLFVMGIAPLILAYALIARFHWPWLAALFRWSAHYWAWTGTLILVLVLAVWLAFQAAFLGFGASVQVMTAFNGLMILLSTVWPSVREFFLEREQ